MGSMQSPQAKPEAIVEQEEETVKFYGSLEWSDAWGDLGTAVYNYGIYSFTVNGGEPYWESGDKVAHTTGGGLYLDEAYYGMATSTTSQKAMSTFYKYDANTWKYISSSYYESPPSLSYSRAMAHDYTTGKTFAIGLNVNSTTVNLREVNLENGEMTNIANLDRGYDALACDGNGQLYAFYKEPAFPYPVSLYKIDKTTGVSSLVGKLGYNQKAQCSAACYDTRNNKLYWTTEILESYDQYYQETYASYLMEVDTSTGKATPVKKFGNVNVQFSSLYIMDSHPKAPEAVKNLRFEAKPNDLFTGNFSFTLPVNAYDRTALSGNLSVDVYLDGELKFTHSGLKPGASFTTGDVALAGGKHTVKVYCRDSADRKSVPSELPFYVGNDAPEAVRNLQMTVSADHTSATLTWEAPQKGVNGGVLDASTLTYKVVRRPDMTTVAEGITECTLSDTPARVQYLSQYEVYASTSTGQSPVAYTSPSILGAARNIPYLQTFDTQTEFNSMFTLDPKGIAKEDGQYWMYYPNYQLAIYFLSYSNRIAVDGWMVTPALNFKESYVYRLSYQTQGWASGGPYPRTVDIHLGRYPTVEALNRQVASDTYNLYNNDKAVGTLLFKTEKDDAFLGFHVTGTAYDHASLDNIRIIEYGPSSIPAAPTLVSTNNENNKASVTVELPTVDVAGNPTAKITSVSLLSKDFSRRIATVTVDDGSDVATVVDNNPEFGVNDYLVVAHNEFGDGLGLNVSVNMKPDVPKPVENFVLATANNGSDAVLSWNYPSDMLGVDGNELTSDDITYDIYRTVSVTKELLASVTGKTSHIFTNVTEPYANARQTLITYTVVARTAGGEAKGVEKRGLFGPSFEMPISENFADGSDLKPWDNSRSTNCSYYTLSRGYKPDCTPTEGKVLTFSPSTNNTMCKGQYVSPRINLTGLENPKFNFTVYRSTDTNVTNATVQIGLIVEKDGVEQDMVVISDTYQVKAAQNGWTAYSVDLAPYASYSRASIVLCCQNNNRDGCIHFDKLELTGDKPQYDARMVSFEGPSVALMGMDNNYSVAVANNGVKQLDGLSVTLFADDAPVATQNVSIAVGGQAELNFIYSPGLDENVRRVELRAEISGGGDANPYNNTAQLFVDIQAPNLPYVTDLQAYGSEQGVHLMWGDAEYYPNEVAEVDNFESYKDFAISNIGEWTLHDMDGQTTLLGISNGTTNYTWENVGLPQAFIVFNPKKAGLGGYWSARSGDKCLVSFAAAEKNNDWLVSPPLSGHEQEVSFYVAAFLSGFVETYDFMVSNSGNQPSDFTPLRENVRISSDAWREQTYTLPAGTRYFAIVCTSPNSWGLMIDDISYTPQQPSVELTGYNVYRDGQRHVEGLAENEFIDSNINPNQEYRYNVTATYTDGESIFSNTVVLVPASVDAVYGEDCSIHTIPGAIVVKVASTTPVAVFGVDGKCLYSVTTRQTQTFPAAPGVYVVKAGTTTAKVIVK